MSGTRNGRGGGPLSEVLGDRAVDRGALGDQVYEHVIDAIDFTALYQLEQMLWSLVGDGPDEHTAQQLITDALARVAKDERRYCSFVPLGITKAEEKAASYDDSCPLCRMEAQSPPESEHDHEGECSLCDDMAREWRAENAEALRRFGLRASKGARKSAASRN
ncbi:MAG: hypothetical protein H0T46_10800 [Deltaproteobacteria bacterium]|nr:hypothetical protein [Deltaproteobacteria bacterium]